jgi:hypothetical protein
MLEVEATFVAEPVEEKYVEIRTTAGDRLVTAIEILSRSNKTPGDDARGAYRQKQTEFRTHRVNLVEIDLLRGGAHTTAIPLGQLRQRASAFDYHVCVSVAGHYFIAPIRLADRLPTFAVPLEGDAGPVSLDLQPLIDRAYDTGRYDATMYQDPPDPPLTPEQQAWAEAILREKGLIK